MMEETVRCVLLMSAAVMVASIKISGVPGDSLVRAGEVMELGVRTDSAWFLCVWTSPRGDKQCAIQESGVSSVCAGDPRIRITGTSHSCGISVTNVTTEDWGSWMSLVQDGEYFETHRTYTKVEVATQAVTTLSWDDNNNQEDQRILRVMEDTQTIIHCNARNAYPQPTFFWYRPDSMELGGEKIVESYNNKTHEYSSNSSVIYNAKLNETNSTITCKVRQDNLYVQEISLTIKVDPKPLPLILDSRADRVGIIAGVILAVIFLLLLFVIVIVIIVQRRKRKVPRQQSPDTTIEDERDFRQVIRPVWRTGASGRYDGNWSKYIHDGRHLTDPVNLSLDTDGSLHSDSGNTINGTRSTKTMSMISESSQSYQTERDLEHISVSLRPGTSLQETHFSEGRDVTTVQHRPSVSYIDQFMPEVYYRKPSSTRSDIIGAGPGRDFSASANYLSSRPASALDLYLHPSHLPQRVSTPTCAGSKTSVSSIFHCQHDCFNEELSSHTIEEMSEEEDIESIKKLVSDGLDVGTDGFTDSSEGDKERKPTATAVTTL